LFKTIKNENNLQSKVKNIYFIVSKNNDTFDDFLSSWKNKKLLSEEIYNSIINLEKDDTKIVKAYKECKTFLQSNPKDKISYIDKIIIEEGFTYDELIVKINEIIKNTFNVNDNIIIFYLRYYVFDLFDKNWFNDNIPLKINEIYSEQIAVLGQKGDLLLALSGRGNSPNIISAVNEAKKIGIETHAILGFSGGICKTLVDYPIHFQINDMQVAEDLQLIVGHMIMQSLEKYHQKNHT
jgi:hypothetical protein